MEFEVCLFWLTLLLLFFFFFFFAVVGSGESGEDELYEQQWKACAGPLVDVPRVGQRVFYFPQGHMEQVSFCKK